MADTTNTAIVQDTPDESQDVSGQKMMTENLFVLGLLFFVFYFLLIRPQQKRLKSHKTLIGGLQKGNKVMTGGGIIGTIIKFEGDDLAVVEIAPNVRVRMARNSISDVVSDKAGVGETANDN